MIAGEGELAINLSKKAGSSAAGERIRFVGRCSDVPSLLAASDVCVLTSSAEGFSNSIIEYMAAARPVIATNVGGAAEAITEGKTGYLVEPDDDRAMASHLCRLLSDGKASIEMGREGRRSVKERFSVERQLTETIELYKQCLS